LGTVAAVLAEVVRGPWYAGVFAGLRRERVAVAAPG